MSQIYVTSLNGCFKKSSYLLKDSLEYAKLIDSKEADRFSSVTVDEIEKSLFEEYLKLEKDDDFLVKNSKLIKEY